METLGELIEALKECIEMEVAYEDTPVRFMAWIGNSDTPVELQELVGLYTTNGIFEISIGGNG